MVLLIALDTCFASSVVFSSSLFLLRRLIIKVIAESNATADNTAMTMTHLCLFPDNERQNQGKALLYSAGGSYQLKCVHILFANLNRGNFGFTK